MPRAVMDGIPRKMRPHGRPKLRNELEKDLTQLGVDRDWRREALDQPRWRQLIKTVCDLQGIRGFMARLAFIEECGEKRREGAPASAGLGLIKFNVQNTFQKYHNQFIIEGGTFSIPFPLDQHVSVKWNQIIAACSSNENDQQPTFEDFVRMDNDVLVSAELTDNDIISEFLEIEQEEEEEGCETCEEPLERVSKP
uniref:(California timema) hypothetical protein n=1 Tax=Timema californicum TaxID=61474 RepID=A0A7R9J9R4_TIMCA|nr:unnamed protein product [Timema californicum]